VSCFYSNVLSAAAPRCSIVFCAVLSSHISYEREKDPGSRNPDSLRQLKPIFHYYSSLLLSSPLLSRYLVFSVVEFIVESVFYFSFIFLSGMSST
jgi:hypothetical protein